MQLLLPLLAGLSVALLVIAIGRPNRSADARRRIARLQEAPAVDPMTLSFGARVMLPLVTGVTDTVTGVLPSRIDAAVRRNMEMAGNPISLRRFTVAWLATGIVSPLLLLVVLAVLNASSGSRIILATFLWSLVGLYLPWFWLRRSVRARGRLIQRALPDAIDLVITNVEAGLGLQAALLMVSEKMAGPTGVEFGRVVRDISLGRDRASAFEQMAARAGIADMRLFARAVSQSEQTGAPIARVLRNYAAESRERRRQRAREAAGKVPVKITLPTVLFMFPTLLILILGPVFIYAMDALGTPR